MEIDIKNIGLNGLSVRASGRLDLDTAVEYGTTIKNAIEDANETINEVVLDFGEITFISSFGLKIILELFKQMQEQGGVLKLQNVSEAIQNSFKMVGFDKFLVIE